MRVHKKKTSELDVCLHDGATIGPGSSVAVSAVVVIVLVCLSRPAATESQAAAGRREREGSAKSRHRAHGLRQLGSAARRPKQLDRPTVTEGADTAWCWRSRRRPERQRVFPRRQARCVSCSHFLVVGHRCGL